MRLHDPKTEKEVLRIAKRAAGERGLEPQDCGWWTGLFSKILLGFFVILMTYGFLRGLAGSPESKPISLMVCAVAMMFLVRTGSMFLAATAQRSGLFTAMANAPIMGSQALAYIRYRFFRKSLFSACSISALIAFGLLGHEEIPRAITTAVLLLAVTYSTVILCENRWISRFRLVKIWHLAGWLVVAYLIAIYFNGMSRPFLTGPYEVRMLWVFPPVWVLPGFREHGGLLVAAIWIFWGAWNWIRWPSTAYPEFDKPYDFVSAFGNFSREEKPLSGPTEPLSSQMEERKDTSEEKGWVNRLVSRSISPADKPIAVALLDPGKRWTLFTNLALLLSPLWLLAFWLGRDFIPPGDPGETFRTVIWIIPATGMILTIFPHSNGIQRATDPIPLGNSHVPFFCTLPVSIRSLLRISQRMTMVRCIIFCLIATPFFCLLAILDGTPELAYGLLGAIPAFAVVWYFSRPILIWHRIQAAMKRRRGAFFLHYASAGVEVILFFLWAIASICGVGAAYAWATETSSFLLLPASLIGITLSAVFSRIILEIAINEMRHRRYDWIAKPK